MNNHKQKRYLSQFFTPAAVVQFMFDLVGFNPLWKVVDPACGDGVFFKKALRRGASAVAGVDIDLEAIESARENLQEFESRFRLFCQDGLTEKTSSLTATCATCASGSSTISRSTRWWGSPETPSRKWAHLPRRLSCIWRSASRQKVIRQFWPKLSGLI